MKLKHIVAALALVAAGSANAAIDAGQTTNGTGELFLVVTDTTAGYSFVGDLGVGMDSFLPTASTSQSWNLGGFTAWNSFVVAIGGDLSNAKYAVYSFDNVGSNAVEAKRLLTTVAAGDDVSSYTTTNTKLGGAVGGTVNTALGKMTVDANNLTNNHDTLANGSSYTSSAKSLGYAESQLGDKLISNTQFITTVVASDKADFWLLGNSNASSSTNTLAQANLYQQAGQFSLSDSTLAYAVAAPVPEPETYALMLAGLGLVGFMARRRKIV